MLVAVRKLDAWAAELVLPAGTSFKYKLVLAYVINEAGKRPHN
jgi:hypothetical protein